MYAGPLDVLHDPRDEDALAVANGVDLDLFAFEVLVDQDRPSGRGDCARSRSSATTTAPVEVGPTAEIAAEPAAELAAIEAEPTEAPAPAETVAELAAAAETAAPVAITPTDGAVAEQESPVAATEVSVDPAAVIPAPIEATWPAEAAGDSAEEAQPVTAAQAPTVSETVVDEVAPAETIAEPAAEPETAAPIELAPAGEIAAEF